jgi:hypothetical protein
MLNRLIDIENRSGLDSIVKIMAGGIPHYIYTQTQQSNAFTIANPPQLKPPHGPNHIPDTTGGPL